METVWILGDQLNRHVASLARAHPSATRILLIESAAKLGARRWHRQRLHLVLAAMRRFAASLEHEGFSVDYRRAPSFAAGLAAHRERFGPSRVRAMEPTSWDGLRTLEQLDVDVVRSDQMLCHRDEFAAWAGDRSRLKLDDFYRWQRRRFGYLMTNAEPAGGRWSFDAENREPPPRDAAPWPEPWRERLDEIDAAVLADLPGNVFGAEPTGLWPTSRAAALARLARFVEHALPVFGPHQDAMTTRSWHLAHSLLSSSLNLGLLHPREVCDAAEAAWRAGRVPLASAEGFLRQVLGWREYVWGVYWLWMPRYRAENRLGARRRLPPAFHDPSRTRMRCLAESLRDVEERAYAHHIQRLMVFGNLALTAAVEPRALVEWMWASFVDGAEWVMLPNVVGMALHADGGRIATKPYAAGGAYVKRMSDYCRGCVYDPARRTGSDACPLTTLYWAFLDRHRERFARNPRMLRPLAGLATLRDIAAVRARAAEVLAKLDTGEI